MSTGHDSAVSLIKYAVGSAVSMGSHGSCISAHGAAVRWTRYAFHSRVVSRHGRAVPQYFYLVRKTIFKLIPTPTYNAICAGSFDVPAEIVFFQFVFNKITLWIFYCHITFEINDCIIAYYKSDARRKGIGALFCRVWTRLCCEKHSMSSARCSETHEPCQPIDTTGPTPYLIRDTAESCPVHALAIRSFLRV